MGSCGPKQKLFARGHLQVCFALICGISELQVTSKRPFEFAPKLAVHKNIGDTQVQAKTPKPYPVYLQKDGAKHK